MIFSNHIFPLLQPKKSAINTLIVSSFFRIAGMSMLVLFSAVYIYTRSLEFGLSYSQAIYYILLFYFLVFTTKFVFLFLAQKYSLKSGFKHTIWLSALPFSFFIPLIILSETYFWLIPIAGIFWGAYAGLFWWGYHGFFIKSQRTGKYGETIGLSLFVHTIAAVVMPISGALLIERFGFVSIYILAFILVIASLLVLGRADDVSQKHDVTVKQVVKLFSNKKAFVTTLITRGLSLETYATFWQLYLFLIFKTVLDLGLIASVSVLITSFMMIFIGKYVDHHGSGKTITYVSPLLALAWLVRFFSVGLFSIISANTLGSFSETALGVSVDEHVYKIADTEFTSPILLLREISLIFGVYATLLIVLVLTLFSFDLKTLFAIVAITSLLPIYLSKFYAEKK